MDEIVKEDKPVKYLHDMKPEHRGFVLAILNNTNPTRAYMSVYPDATFKTAQSASSELMHKPEIKAVLTRELDRRAMQADEIIHKQGTLARGNIADVIEMVNEPVLDRHGDPLLRNGQPVYRQVPHLREGALEQYGYMIKSIRPANGGGVAVEMYSVQDALSAMERIRRLVSDTPPAINVEQVVIYLPDNERQRPSDQPAIDATIQDIPDNEEETSV